MPGVVSSLQQIFVDTVQRNFFNTFLKIRHVGSLKRVRSLTRWQAYGAVLRSLVAYPLPDAQAQAHLLHLKQPCALKTETETAAALNHVLSLGLQPHKSRQKNWDFLAAFSAILARGRKEDVVIDLGSGPTSVILEWLHLYGYVHLQGCDLLIEPHQTGHIQYTRQNLEQTSFATGSADVVTCLSVIEHGVTPERFFAEVRRLLKPGGLLVVSTDYWCVARDLYGVRDELGDVFVYTPETIKALLDTAQRSGLTPVGSADYNCGEPVVERPNIPELHKNYTFYYMAFIAG